MIIAHSDTRQLSGTPWYMLELSTDRAEMRPDSEWHHRIEGIFRRLLEQAPKLLADSPAEIFLPIVKRDLAFCELSFPYIFARTEPWTKVRTLLSVKGVKYVYCDNSKQPPKPIPVADDYVQALIAESERAHQAQCSGIGPGSFVRILDSHLRGFCGTVESIRGSRAVVRIRLKTKRILVETRITNLLNLNHVPESRRVFYYCPLVAELEHTSVLRDDLAVPERLAFCAD